MLPPNNRPLLAIALSLIVTASLADESASLELFEKHVRPTLVEQCIRCHGPNKQQGGLRLDSRDFLLKGGDSGAAIKPGAPEESLLVRAIRYDDNELEMPPRGRLPDQTIAGIEKWIKLGAHDPRVATSGSSGGPAPPSVAEGRRFWSFQPITNPTVPEVSNASWPITNIDRFVLAQLESKNLVPVAEADRETLVRRVFYDLIGLPPTPQQVHAFVADPSDDAYEKLIDELLDSPHFGERWGRHWLDVVRFAESSGGGRTLLFPNAWRYRDYVIESFNDDVPYDQFLKEQLAGDLMESSDWQDQRRKLTATAFLLLGPTNYEMQDKDILEMDVVDEQLDTMGKALMGMTIGCARCHDHKFDPIPTVDYYALAGILKSTKAMIHSNVSAWNKVELPLPPAEEAAIAVHQKKIDAVKANLANATGAWKKAGGQPNNKRKSPPSVDPSTLAGIVVDDEAAERMGDWMESTSNPGFVGQRYIHDKTEDKGSKQVIYRPQLPAAGSYEVRVSHTAGSNRSTRVPVYVHHADGETIVKVNQKRQAKIDGVFTSLGTFKFDPAADPRVVISNKDTDDGVVIADAVVFISLDSVTAPAEQKTKKETTPVKQPDKQQLAVLKKVVDELQAELKTLQAAAPKRPVAMVTADDDDAGDIHLAISGVVSHQGEIVPRGVMQVASFDTWPAIPEGQSGRRELADWIANDQHPLTARVMANRVWHWLIGRGLVSSVDNFGATGQPPTHPELLDYLATSLIQQGWSIKQLVRQITLSRVYRLSSVTHAGNLPIDPDNKWLWRMNRKRLHAEDIRDTLLFVSNSLEPQRGGPSIKPGTKIEYGYRFDGARRSVYVPVFRNTLPELFEVFDFADPNIQQGQRTTSTIASQALLMMNHPFVIKQAELAAEQMPAKVQFDTIAGVQHAYYQVLGRAPSDQEQGIAIDFIESELPPTGKTTRQTRWTMLYQTLFQCVDFRYLN